MQLVKKHYIINQCHGRIPTTWRIAKTITVVATRTRGQTASNTTLGIRVAKLSMAKHKMEQCFSYNEEAEQDQLQWCTLVPRG